MALFLSRMLVEFSLTYISTMYDKNFQIYDVNALNLGSFTHTLFSHSKLQAEFFENLFHPTAERGGESYDLLYQNSIRKYVEDLEH